MIRRKRGYSYDFTASRTERDIHISLRRVPSDLHGQFKARCTHEGLSMRHTLLRWMRNWLAGRRPDEDDVPPPPVREAIRCASQFE